MVGPRAPGSFIRGLDRDAGNWCSSRYGRQNRIPEAEGLRNRNPFSPSSGHLESKVKVLAGLVPPKASPWPAGGHLDTVSSRGLFSVGV